MSACRCRDNEVLAALRRSLETRGRMPTMKELCSDVRIQRGQIYRNLDRLVARGAITPLPLGTVRFVIVAEGAVA